MHVALCNHSKLIARVALDWQELMLRSWQRPAFYFPLVTSITLGPKPASNPVGTVGPLPQVTAPEAWTCPFW